MSAANAVNRKRILNDYRIGKTLGEGAFSKVKFAVHKQLDLKVAIKIIKKDEDPEKKNTPKDKKSDKEETDEDNKINPPIPTASSSPTSSPNRIDQSVLLSSLTKEVRLLMRLDHPNIIKLYQVFDTDSELYIVMEYAKGELIDYIAASGSLNEKEARKYLRQLTSALDHCHAAGVVHRDLKLENLLLSHEKNLILSDFGLGRTIIANDQTLGTFCGTPLYAAPELVSATRYAGPPADIWSMGVVLYIMCAGKPPFQANTIGDLYKKIKAVNYPVPEKFSAPLKDLLSIVLVRDPAARADIETVRIHPWTNEGFDSFPLRLLPAVPLQDVREDQIDRLVSHIQQRPGYVAYTLRHASKLVTDAHEGDTFTPLPYIHKLDTTNEDGLGSQPVSTGASSHRTTPTQSFDFTKDSLDDRFPPAPSPSAVNDRNRRHSVAVPASVHNNHAPVRVPPSFGSVPPRAVPSATPTYPSSSAAPGPLAGRVRRYSMAVDSPAGLPAPLRVNLPEQEPVAIRRRGSITPGILGRNAPDHYAPALSPLADTNVVHDPSTLRALRFAFTDTTTTSKETPLSLYERLRGILDTLKPSHNLKYEQVGSWTFMCKVPHDADGARQFIVFEAEICKVWLLKLHGIRIKRLAGNALEYKALYEKIVAILNL